jgi:hypothetical protein
MAIDIKDFYLKTSLARPEFLKMKLSNFPDNVIEHSQFKDKYDSKGFVYVRCIKGVYGLTDARIIDHKFLGERLNNQDYYQSKRTPGF